MRQFTSTLFFTLCSVVFLASCQKEFVRPEEIIEEPLPVFIPDSLVMNFIWVAPTSAESNLVGARLELRDMSDSLRLSGLDVMSSQDTVFQWYPSIGLKSEQYYFKLKSPTGQVLDSCSFDFHDALGKDEWIIQQPDFNYYIQLRWVSESEMPISQ